MNPSSISAATGGDPVLYLGANTYSTSNGELLDLGADAVLSVTGTANQVTASPTTGAVILSLPNAITAPGSLATTTTFTSGGALTVSSGGANVTGNSSVTGNLDVTGIVSTPALHVLGQVAPAVSLAYEGTAAIQRGIPPDLGFGNPGTPISVAVTSAGAFTGTIGPTTAQFGVFTATSVDDLPSGGVAIVQVDLSYAVSSGIDIYKAWILPDTPDNSVLFTIGTFFPGGNAVRFLVLNTYPGSLTAPWSIKVAWQRELWF